MSHTDLSHSEAVAPDSHPTADVPNRRGLQSAVVMVLSLAAGAGAMWFAVQSGWIGRTSPAPAVAAPAATEPSAGAPAGEAPSDRAVYLSPGRQQIMGVRTAPVSVRRLETTIRTVGVLAYDETKIAEVHTKIAGWIDQASVDFVGKSVSRGQPLFSVYSPDLVATQREYLLALKAQAQLGQSQFADTRSGATSLVAAARERLRLWDITDAQVAELERTGTPAKSLTIYSPFDGVVLERGAFPGQYVTPEMSAFKIADLATVWVIGQVFENELRLIKIGQTATVEFPNTGAPPLTGAISYIYPDVDPATRRAKVRIELHNAGLQFKPETYVTVVIRSAAAEHLAIPKEAVIDTGVKQYAIVALDDGYFEPRDIRVGQAVDEAYPVVAGLAPGDRVVTSAQFLIDSETNLQAAMQAMAGMPTPQAASVGNSRSQDASAPASPPAATSRLDVTLRTSPDPPRMGDNVLEVVVKDASGSPVTDAAVEVMFFMPAMPSMGMPAMRSAATLVHASDGLYRGSGKVLGPGRWDVTVSVTRSGQRLATKRLAIVAQ